jgi:hypothetical protein
MCLYQFFYGQSVTGFKITLRAVVRELHRLKDEQFQRGEGVFKNDKKMQKKS